MHPTVCEFYRYFRKQYSDIFQGSRPEVDSLFRETAEEIQLVLLQKMLREKSVVCNTPARILQWLCETVHSNLAS
jgi:hypothetical protein